MSGSNRLINNENELEGGSEAELASDLNNANEIAGQISDSGSDKESD